MRRFFTLMSLTMQGRMYYRASFILNLITPLILLAGQFLLWGALYGARGGEALGEYDRAEMFSYILVVFAINNLLTWVSENQLAREIRSGMVTARRLRPVSLLGQSLADMTGNMLLQGIVNGGIVVLIFIVFSRQLAMPSLAAIPAFLPSLLMALLLRMLLVYCFSLLCFFTTGHLGITWTRQALTDFFSGALIPITLFPAWLQSISAVLPFPLMLQMPVSILLGQPLPMPLWQSYALQILWIGVFLAAQALLYGRIRRTATLAGG